MADWNGQDPHDQKVFSIRDVERILERHDADMDFISQLAELQQDGKEFTVRLDERTFQRLLNVHADRPGEPEPPDGMTPEQAEAMQLQATFENVFLFGLRQSEAEIENERRWMEQERDDSDIPF